MKQFRPLWIASLGLLIGCCVALPAVTAEETKEKKMESVLDFSMNGIDGKEVPLDKYKGNVLLVVNVASECGLTPQYEGLQAIYEKYKEKGFTVLAFPANNFGAQEPGTSAEIREFCTVNYGVKFDLFEKVSVKGDDKCDLYKFLTEEETAGEFAGEIEWNFGKFLIGRNGDTIHRFHPKITPQSDEVIGAIEKALEAPKPKD